MVQYMLQQKRSLGFSLFLKKLDSSQPEPPPVLGIAPKYKICCYIHPYCCRETVVSKLLCEHPAFNQENQDPVSKKGVIVWKSCKGK
jgi:hypothetical protein